MAGEREGGVGGEEERMARRLGQLWRGRGVPWSGGKAEREREMPWGGGWMKRWLGCHLSLLLEHVIGLGLGMGRHGDVQVGQGEAREG